MYRPQKAAQMTTPARLLLPKSENVHGVIKKTYTEAAYITMCNFSAYSSAETESDGLGVVAENVTVTAFYDPAISAGCRLKKLDDGAVFEIVGTPENVEMRNMFCVFKVQRVRGGA